MLSIPMFAEIEGISIFRDDADPTRFYYLPRMPRLVKSDDGKPMFTFLRYQFPIERDASEPGGGYLVFTTSLTEDSQILENNVKPVLKTRLRSENPLSVEIPEPVISPVSYSGGEVRLIIMRNNQFVKAVNLGSPSLFANNTASVAIELPADGATLFYEALKGGGSIGAIEYNLRFSVRLPAITIIGHIASKEFKDVDMTNAIEKISKPDWKGQHSRSERAHRTSISETLESMGLVHLEILKGNVELGEDDEESIRAFAFRMMDEFIRKHFMTGATVVTDEDLKSQWMTAIDTNIDTTFDLNVTYRDVITRVYNPSAQINPSFLGVDINSVVQDIDLGSAPWYFNNLGVTIDTNLDFNKYGDIIHSVVGHLSYDQKKSDGTPMVKRESVKFSADDTSSKQFKARLAEVGKDFYHVDVEVNYKSGPVLTRKLKSFDTNVRHLVLDVPNPGVMEIYVSCSPTAFEQSLASIEVEIEYSDKRNNVPQVCETVILDKDKPERLYRRVIYAPWEKPFRYRYTYVFIDEEEHTWRSTTHWVEASSATKYLRVSTPFDEQFSLTILPSVDWQEIKSLVVDLEYDDTDSDYRKQHHFSFSKESSGVKSWKFNLRNPDYRKYRFKQTFMKHNDAVVEEEWQEQESDAQTLVVGNAPGGVIIIEVDPCDVDIGGEVKRIKVNLSYSDPDNDVLDTEAFLFRKNEIQYWSIARKDASVTAYTYDIVYYMKDGSQKSLADQKGNISSIRDFLFIPPPPTT